MLDESKEGVPPYELSKQLIFRGKAYFGKEEKTARKIRSWVGDKLRNLEKLQIIEKAGEKPSSRTTTIMQPTYSLSALGKMIVSLLLLDINAKAVSSRQREDIRQYLMSVKKSDPWQDFLFDFFLELMNTGQSNMVTRYFVSFSRIVCEHDPTSLKQLQSRWASELSVEESRSWVQALLKVLRPLPASRRKFVELALKNEREQAYLLKEPDMYYVRAVASGGKLVHIPFSCPSCKAKSVVRKTVEKMLEDDAIGARDRCPACQAVRIPPRL